MSTRRLSALAEAQLAAEEAVQAAAVAAEKVAALSQMATPERVAMTFRIRKEARKLLRRAAYEHEISQQEVMDRALDLVFAEHENALP